MHRLSIEFTLLSLWQFIRQTTLFNLCNLEIVLMIMLCCILVINYHYSFLFIYFSIDLIFISIIQPLLYCLFFSKASWSIKVFFPCNPGINLTKIINTFTRFFLSFGVVFMFGFYSSIRRLKQTFQLPFNNFSLAYKFDLDSNNN